MKICETGSKNLYASSLYIYIKYDTPVLCLIWSTTNLLQYVQFIDG